jgi:hypothetical protein
VVFIDSITVTIALVFKNLQSIISSMQFLKIANPKRFAQPSSNFILQEINPSMHDISDFLERRRKQRKRNEKRKINISPGYYARKNSSFKNRYRARIFIPQPEASIQN